MQGDSADVHLDMALILNCKDKRPHSLNNSLMKQLLFNICTMIMGLLAVHYYLNINKPIIGRLWQHGQGHVTPILE